MFVQLNRNIVHAKIQTGRMYTGPESDRPADKMAQILQQSMSTLHYKSGCSDAAHTGHKETKHAID